MSVVFHRSGRALRRTNDCPAIFVHAGAGYHSIQNEHVHLQACEDAAVAAMAVLRAGGRAVEAVEMAIKVLEDREITNAGYGSNLALDGQVEGDAIVVDHNGRSGGVGAISQVKNPISVAKKVLEATTQPLSLRRVPPNLIVGQGATDWAFNHGIPILPPDALVSPAAKERWTRWKKDLLNEEKRNDKRQKRLESRHAPSDPPPDYEDPIREQMKREQTKVNRECVWNEGQPTSPLPSGISCSAPVPRRGSQSPSSSMGSHSQCITPLSQPSDIEEFPSSHASRRDPVERSCAPSPLSQDLRNAADMHDSAADDSTLESSWRDSERGRTSVDEEQEGHQQHWAESIWNRLLGDSDDEVSSDSTLRLPSLTPSPPGSVLPERQASPRSGSDDTSSASISTSADEEPAQFRRPPEIEEGRQDLVTDTVGAIAIDNEGNVACGASSGGIGMKFRGRMGPAALVGVGAAVVPQDPEDRSKATTSVVTSGTGEHMGTTMAAQICADRLYHSVKKRRGGGFEACEDDHAIKSFIETDFMGHPSVKQSQSMGAIGVLAVKKTSYGIYLYFAHNTDSFALASMYADEPKPTCTMSRSHGNGMVAQGGRAMRYRKKW